MAYPVAVIEYSPSTGTKKVYPVASNGLDEDTTNPNYVAFRFNCLTSRSIGGTVYQLCSYWNDSLKLVLGVRNDGGSGNISAASWTFYTYDGTGGLADIEKSEIDAHNVIAHEIDSSGIIHLAYDHHNVALNYRRSTVSVASFTGALTAELSMLGTNETSVSYPTFVVDPTGVLHFFFRNGISGNGDTYFYTYNTGTTSWAAGFGTTAGLLFEGTTGSPTQNLYHAKPLFTDDWDGAGTGWLCVGGACRVPAGDAGDDHDVLFFRGDGTSWKQIDGTAQTVPVTISNCDIIDPVPENVGLASFMGMALDSSGNPHFAYAYTSSSRDRLFHTYWNGSAWVISAIDFEFATTDRLDNDTQKIVLDGDDQAYIFSRESQAGTGVFCYRSRGTDYTKWDLQQITSEDVLLSTRYWTGTFHDEYQWKNHGKWMTLVPLTGVSGGATDSFPESWDNVWKATISNPTSAVTDGIFILDMADLPAAFWSTVESDFSDLAFSIDGETRTPGFVLEETYASETGTVVGRFSGVLPSSGTNELYIHWGNASAATPAVDSLYGETGCFRRGVRFIDPMGAGTNHTTNVFSMTASGAPTRGGAAGPFGTLPATDYNGTDQRYEHASLVPTLSPGFSCMAWANSDSVTVNQCVAGVWAASGTNAADLRMEGATALDPVTARTNFSGTATASAGDYVAGTWYHVAGVWSGAASRIAYNNGVAGTENTTSKSFTPARMGVGATLATPSSFFDGKLSFVQIYAEPITAAEIAWQSSQSNQSTFWGTWADANPTTSGLLLANAAYFGGRL